MKSFLTSILFFCRLFFIVIWCFGCSIFGLICSPFKWKDPSLFPFFCRFMANGVITICGLKVIPEGLEYLEQEHRPAVYIGNHQSAMDVATFGTIVPPKTTVVAKKELSRIPVLGWFLAGIGVLFIDRKNRAGSLAVIEEAVVAIQGGGVSVALLPEGTRNKDGIGLLPFKKGAFHLAINAQVPIVPVVSSSLIGVVSFKHRKLNNGKVYLRVCKPIPTKGMTENDVDRLLLMSREVIEKTLAELNQKPK